MTTDLVAGQQVKYEGVKPWPVLTRSNGDRFSPPGETFWLAYRGSVAHGMYIPPTDPNSIDDIDLMGFVFGSKQDYLGLSEWGSRGTKEIKAGTYDVVLYEIKKAVSLLLQGNPNILSMLWIHPMYTLLDSPASKLLIGHRGLFVGKHVYNAFAGYAHAQSQKMETRDPDELREYLAVTAELKYRGKHPNHKGEMLARPDGVTLTGEPLNVSFWADEKLIARLGHYHRKGENLGYMGDKRKQLVLEHGYDSKNAAHLVRLLRMCIEFMATGELMVHRADATELLDIKRGRWKLADVKALSDQLFEDARAARDKSSLPPEPDRQGVEALLVRILSEYLGVPI